jgi:lambda family phage tail tape measure protein
LRRQVQAAGDTYQYLADKIKQAREEQATTPFKPRKEYLQTQINADLADLAIAQSRYRAGIDALAQRTPAKPSLPRFPGLSVEDEKKKNLAEEKQARDAQTAAAEQQRLNNEIFDQQIKAQDRLFEHGIALDRQRYEMQKRLDDLQSQNRVMRETGVSREIVSNFEDLQRGLRDIEERRMEATAAIVRAKQAQQSAEARSSFAAAGAAALSGGATRFIPKEQLRAWLVKQGFGRTTGDFTNRGHRTPNHTLNAMDMGILGGSDAEALRRTADMERKLAATGAFGTQLFGPIRDPYGHGAGRGGQNIHLHIPTRGGKVPLTPGLAALMGLEGTGKLPAGVAAQQNRAIKAGGGAALEGLDVTQAERQQQLLESKVAEERAALFEQFTLKASASLRDQNTALRDNAELQKLRNRLTLEGVSSSQIDLEEELLKVRQAQNKQQQTYNDLIAKAKDPAEQATLNTALAEQNAGFAEQVRLLREAAAAKREFDDAMQFRQDSDIGKGLRDGAKSYVESIGTMREATSQLAQTGIKGVEDAILSLVTTGTANFRDFAKQILENTARMIIQQLILRTVMQAIGAIGGGGGSALAKTFEMPGAGFPTSGFKFANGGAFASNGIVPFAMGGVVNRPTMFAFANGGVGRLGLMGEAGPEAIMPLRRLPSGRLGIESAGGGAPVTVNVSVDATGSQVQGDAGQASQLARVVAGAVQAELIKQKRPGGILSS